MSYSPEKKKILSANLISVAVPLQRFELETKLNYDEILRASKTRSFSNNEPIE